MVIDTKEGIALYRLLALKHALALEMKGMRMTRRSTAYAMIKHEFGFRGSREKVLAQLEKYIAENFPPGSVQLTKEEERG